MAAVLGDDGPWPWRGDCERARSSRVPARRGARRSHRQWRGRRNPGSGGATLDNRGAQWRPAFAGASARRRESRRDRECGARGDRGHALRYQERSARRKAGRLRAADALMGERSTTNGQRPTLNSESHLSVGRCRFDVGRSRLPPGELLHASAHEPTGEKLRALLLELRFHSSRRGLTRCFSRRRTSSASRSTKRVRRCCCRGRGSRNSCSFISSRRCWARQSSATRRCIRLRCSSRTSASTRAGKATSSGRW